MREYLGSQSIAKLKNFVGQNTLLVVDEAQNVPEIGLNLKLIVDHIKGIATGSASFDFYQKTGEPLTGRKTTPKLFPLAQLELSTQENLHEAKANMETRLLYLGV